MKIGCVIMASGMGKRFGSNKLLHPVHGQPMAAVLMEKVSRVDFACRVTVTRHREVAALSEERGIPAVLHDLPLRSDTVRLGVEYLLNQCPRLDGILFAAADQPCLKEESLKRLLGAQEAQPEKIHRLAFGDTAGNPVVFPSWAFPELLTLPEGKGGGVLIRKYPQQVAVVEAEDPKELMDADTPEALQALEA